MTTDALLEALDLKCRFVFCCQVDSLKALRLLVAKVWEPHAGLALKDLPSNPMPGEEALAQCKVPLRRPCTCQSINEFI